MNKILVCGGAGYIGSHMVKILGAKGFSPVVFDNLSTGHRVSVGKTELHKGDLLDENALARVFAAHQFDAVLHFSALSQVAESVAEPTRYYRNNVSGTLNLLAAMKVAKVNRIVFSSSAAVYGNPSALPVREDNPTAPINPYGASKFMVERILQDASSVSGLRSVALRYFNAAGADPSGEIGEAHYPETHLLPNVLRAAKDGGKAVVQVYGNDYDTHDGTCVRDFVHVNDIARAHSLALRYLEEISGAHVFNLGSGAGFSVLEVLAAARQVTGADIKFEVLPRRKGDPATLVADSAKAARELGWHREFEDLRSIVETAWRWHRCPRY